MTINPGQTTKQMMGAPRGAMFVWSSRSTLAYATKLAAHLERDDLIISGPQVFDHGVAPLLGRNLPAIVLDHAAWQAMTNRQLDVCREAQEAIQIRRGAK